MPRKCSFETTS